MKKLLLVFITQNLLLLSFSQADDFRVTQHGHTDLLSERMNRTNILPEELQKHVLNLERPDAITDSLGEEFAMHWPQMPRPGGWDIGFTGSKLGDDFLCTGEGSINNIRFWISFKDDLLPQIQQFTVSFWSNCTMGQYGTPCEQKWSGTFHAGEFTVVPMPGILQGWYDPMLQHWTPDDHYSWYEVTVSNILYPFPAQMGTTYWMVLDFGELANVGWKESDGPQFNSPAVYQPGRSGEWVPIIGPGEPVDLSFILSEEEILSLDVTAMPDTVCAGEMVQLHAEYSGGSGTYDLTWFSIPAGFEATNNCCPVVTPALPTTYYAVLWDGYTWLADSARVYVPTVICGEDMTVCIDEPCFPLTCCTPPGGNYTGNGVSGGVFCPVMAGAGTHTITYTRIDPLTGCVNSCSFTITVTGQVCQTIPYVEGVKWISFNVLPETATVNNVMAGFTAQQGDVLKNQNQSMMFTGTAWVPNLIIDPDNTYLLKTARPNGSFQVCGCDYINQQDPISINANGWTWIGYKPRVPLTPAQAFVSMAGTFTNGDVVKSQTASCLYSGGNWWPPTFKMIPGLGYKLKYQRTPGDTLIYPPADGTGMVFIEEPVSEPVKSLKGDPGWVAMPGMETNMSVFVKSVINDKIHVINGKVAAFDAKTNQCRAVEAFLDAKGSGQAIITVGFNSDEMGNSCYYLVWNSTNNMIYRANETGVMIADDIRMVDLTLISIDESVNGSGSLPVHQMPSNNQEGKYLPEIQFSEKSGLDIQPLSKEFRILPNPSQGLITIEGTDETVRVEIFNACGEKIYADQRNSLPAMIDLSTQPKGIYFIKIETKNNVFFEKLIIN